MLYIDFHVRNVSQNNVKPKLQNEYCLLITCVEICVHFDIRSQMVNIKHNFKSIFKLCAAAYGRAFQ